MGAFCFLPPEQGKGRAAATRNGPAGRPDAIRQAAPFTPCRLPTGDSPIAALSTAARIPL